MWSGRRYHSLDHYLKQTFGEKLYKLSLDGGMTCPNRDGRLSYGGCIFCSANGSGDFSAPVCSGVNDQIEFARKMISDKYNGNRYIAYFQSFTNTYAPVGRLRELFEPVIRRDDIAVLDIATRPDCLEAEKTELIGSLAKIKPVWVELGLQTSDDETARIINRCYPTKQYDTAVKRLHEVGAKVITHMIIGLPGEDREDMINTAKHIADCGSDGIKLQLMHILSGTVLAEMYSRGEFSALSEEEYIDLVCDIISVLPEEMVIHRLTGDGSKDKLIAPLWSCDKRRVLNRINHALKEKDIIQGCSERSVSR